MSAGGVPARLYRPASASRDGVLVYLHGGGWVVGGLDSHDAVARALCRRGALSVLSVDYRLAPEHPFPAPYEDCLAATRWALSSLDGPVVVGGDSAGGNLAAAVALTLGSSLAGQLLVYPALDGAGSHPSHSALASGWFLELEDMQWYWAQYAGTTPRTEPLLSPLLAPSLAGLAPAVVVTAEYDLLRDEGDAYAARLASAGVPVRHWVEAGLTHGFLGNGATVKAADEAVTEVALAVTALLDDAATPA